MSRCQKQNSHTHTHTHTSIFLEEYYDDVMINENEHAAHRNAWKAGGVLQAQKRWLWLSVVLPSNCSQTGFFTKMVRIHSAQQILVHCFIRFSVKTCAYPAQPGWWGSFVATLQPEGPFISLPPVWQFRGFTPSEAEARRHKVQCSQ